MHTHDDTSELPEKIHDLARALEPTLEMLHNQLQRNWSTIQHSIDIRPVLIHSLTRYQWHLKHLRSLIEDIETKILRAPNPDDWVIEQCCSRLHHETRELLRDYHQLCTYVVYAANIGPHHALCDVYRYTASQLLRLLQDINILASTGVAPTGRARTNRRASSCLSILPHPLRYRKYKPGSTPTALRPASHRHLSATVGPPRTRPLVLIFSVHWDMLPRLDFLPHFLPMMMTNDAANRSLHNHCKRKTIKGEHAGRHFGLHINLA